MGNCRALTYKKEDFEKVDSRKMFQIYDKWPEVAQESFSTDFNNANV